MKPPFCRATSNATRAWGQGWHTRRVLLPTQPGPACARFSGPAQSPARQQIGHCASFLEFPDLDVAIKNFCALELQSDASFLQRHPFIVDHLFDAGSDVVGFAVDDVD